MRTQFVDLHNAQYYATRTEFVRNIIGGKPLCLLDVGNLGDGSECVAVKNMVEEAGGEHHGLDVNENLAKELGVKNQIIGDLHDLSGVVKDEQYDAIYAGEIIEHTWMPGKMITECYRILKPGGLLILDTPNTYSLTNVLRLYFLKKDSVNMDDSELVYHEAKDNFKKWRGELKEVQSQPQHKILFSPAMLRQLLNMHAFAVEQYAFIGKKTDWRHKLLLPLLPRGAQKLGIAARKSTLEEVFRM